MFARFAYKIFGFLTLRSHFHREIFQPTHPRRRSIVWDVERSETLACGLILRWCMVKRVFFERFLQKINTTVESVKKYLKKVQTKQARKTLNKLKTCKRLLKRADKPPFAFSGTYFSFSSNFNGVRWFGIELLIRNYSLWQLLGANKFSFFWKPFDSFNKVHMWRFSFQIHSHSGFESPVIQKSDDQTHGHCFAELREQF